MPFTNPYDPPSFIDGPTLRLWNVVRFGAYDPRTIAEVEHAIAEGADFNARNRFNISLLILAIKFDAPSLPLTRALLAAGASVGLLNQPGSAMSFASRILDQGSTLALLQNEQRRRDALGEQNALNLSVPPASQSSKTPRV